MNYQSIPHRLLFMAIASDPMRRRIKAEAYKWGGSALSAPANPHHMTLAVLDDLTSVPAGLLERLSGSGAAVEAEPFRIVLDRIVGTYSSVALRPSFPSTGLRMLRKAIVGTMRERGIRQRNHYSFSPHVTLFYCDGQPFSRSIDGFDWLVDEFVLIDSRVGRSRYEVLGRWKLRGPTDTQYQLL